MNTADICPSRDDAQRHVFENGICAFCYTKKTSNQMKRITINNYQYWFNEATGTLYTDEAGMQEVSLRSFTAQEMTQFYNAIKSTDLFILKFGK